MKLFWPATLSGLSLSILTILSSPHAHAQGGIGFAIGGIDGGPMVATPAAIFWNPAALAGLEGTHVTVDLQTVAGQGTYQRTPDANAAFYQEVDASVLFPLPFLGVVHDFGLSNWRFGLAVYLPYGSGGQWDPSGPQRYHLIEGAEGSLFVTSTVTYKIRDNLAVGVGGSYIFSALQGEVSFDLATTTQELVQSSFVTIPTESDLFEAHIQTGILTNHNFTFSGGIFYQPTANLDLGLSAQLPVKIRYTGPIDVTLPDAIALAEPVLELIGFDGSTIRADGQITITRPAIVMLGAAWRPMTRLTVESSLYYAFSSFADSFTSELINTGVPYLDAPEGTSVRNTGASNSYQVRGGIKYSLSEQLRMGGFLSFIDPGIPSSHVTASNICFNLLIPSYQLEYRPNQKNRLAVSVSPIVAFKRTVSDSIFDPLAPAGSGIGLPPANGVYKGFALQLGLTYGFKF